MVYMEGSALILQFFIIEHIPGSWPDLMAITSPRMLKWGVIPKYKSMTTVQGTFSGASEQVILDLKPTLDEQVLLISMDQGVEVSPKKIPSALINENQ